MGKGRGGGGKEWRRDEVAKGRSGEGHRAQARGAEAQMSQHAQRNTEGAPASAPRQAPRRWPAPPPHCACHGLGSAAHQRGGPPTKQEWSAMGHVGMGCGQGGRRHLSSRWHNLLSGNSMRIPLSRESLALAPACCTLVLRHSRRAAWLHRCLFLGCRGAAIVRCRWDDGMMMKI